MDNPETQWGTQDTEWRLTKLKHNTDNYKDVQHEPQEKTGSDFLCSWRVSSSYFVHDTHHVAHI